VRHLIPAGEASCEPAFEPVFVTEVPYELSFARRVAITDREQYINDCCIGGDVVLAQLLPALRARYGDVAPNQEDWGWFIWFRKGDVRLAIDVFTDDPGRGEFRIHLTSRVPRLLFLTTVADTPELRELHDVVVTELSAWVGGPVKSEAIDR
jgi:hypothetical protein